MLRTVLPPAPLNPVIRCLISALQRLPGNAMAGSSTQALPLAWPTPKSVVPIPQPQPLTPAEFPLVARDQLGIGRMPYPQSEYP